MEFLWLLVLAITYNQGAARPADDDGYFKNNDLSSSEGFQMKSDDGTIFKIPTNIREDLRIIIKGTMKTDDKWFTVVLPSTNGKKNCQFTYDFEKEVISITPGVKDYKSEAYYNMSINPESGEALPFSLSIKARVELNSFAIIFNGNNSGESAKMMCEVDGFEDINYIVMKEGVAHVDSLLFEFMEDG